MPSRMDAPPPPAPLLRVGEKGPAFFVLILLVTLFCNTRVSPCGAMSAELTAHRNPTFLQQLASFAALRAVAEEEELDWGAPSSLGGAKSYELRLQTNPDALAEETPLTSLRDVSGKAARRRPHRRRRAPLRRSHSKTKCEMNETDEMCEEDEKEVPLTCSLGGSGSHGPTSDGDARSRAHSDADRELDARPPVWSQRPALRTAHTTGDRLLLRRTAHRLRGGMYAVVYECPIQRVPPGRAEAALRSAPRVGVDASRFWSCRLCGMAHQRVCAKCDRCARRGPFAKLFVGQLPKEVDGAVCVLRLLRATHPGVEVHRVEAFAHDKSSRGTGCAAVYVHNDAAQEIIQKLNGNVFFDKPIQREGEDGNDSEDGELGGLVVRYVYSSQREWLNELIATRNAQRMAQNVSSNGFLYRKENRKLPWGALVVQEAVEKSPQVCKRKKERKAGKMHQTVGEYPKE